LVGIVGFDSQHCALAGRLDLYGGCGGDSAFFEESRCWGGFGKSVGRKIGGVGCGLFAGFEMAPTAERGGPEFTHRCGFGGCQGWKNFENFTDQPEAA
jgi:hypothetical protein